MVEKTNSPAWWPGFAEPFRHMGERIADWFAPRAEAKASNAHYEITMELPGVAEGDIDVSLHEGVLTVKGEKNSERKEEGEGYSTIKGFFRQYEQIHIVADERDVIRLRTNYRNDPPEDVYRYRLQIPPESVRLFFLQYVKKINEEKDRPSFYNTLTANCTNVIWKYASIFPGRVPLSWKLFASGYTPEYLYEKGRLDTSRPFAELTQRGYINPVAQALGDATDFSQRIRTE